MERYICLYTILDTWNALSNFFWESDELYVFGLNGRAFTTKQKNKTLIEYYEELIGISRELDYCEKVILKDPEDGKSY